MILSEDSKRSEIWSEFNKIQQSEASLHWQRNSYFSVVASILILAVSQFDNSAFQIIVGFLGLALSIIWLLIQDRSSRYIRYWKNESTKFKSDLGTNIYPSKQELGGIGIEMRILAYFLPMVFLAIWIGIIIISAFDPM